MLNSVFKHFVSTARLWSPSHFLLILFVLLSAIAIDSKREQHLTYLILGGYKLNVTGSSTKFCQSNFETKLKKLTLTSKSIQEETITILKHKTTILH